MRKTTGALLALCALAAAAGRADDPSPEPPGTTIKLAYVCAADNAVAKGFKKLLTGAGFSADLVLLQDAAKADFSRFDVVLTAHDTREWTADLALAVDKAKRPTLGLGVGGSEFLGKLRLGIGAPKGWHASASSLLPADRAKSPFWKSMKAPPKDDKAIQVYKRKSPHVGIYAPKPGKDVVLIGRETGSANHYVIIQEGPRYAMWGFVAGAGAMTPEGRELFLHTCRYVAGLGKDAAPEKKPEK